ncbi:adenine-specific DNA-methyltransferase [Candidatus Magnetomoraceae bacterium gMMP-15]
MYLQYKGKKSEDKIFNISPCELSNNWDEIKNKLIFGENLKILNILLDRYKLKSKVNLVYIDPPFATNNNFTIGENRVSTISNSYNDNIAYSDNLTGGLFLEFLRERLLFIRELMSENASIYLHIDYKIGHYVKIIMDEVFGLKNFRNDITRIKCNPKNFKRKSYGNIKDMILFYSKNKNNIWNEPKDEFTTEDINRLFRKVDKNGRRYTTIPLHAPGETLNGPTGQEWRGMKPPKGRHWRSEPRILEKLDKEGLIEWSKNGVPRKKIYADEKDGKKKQDIWEYKDAQYPNYPTEKNIDMLKTIISASSNPGDLVLDCFCGSGTTLQAAEELGRNWIGIDKSAEAIKVTKKRLSKITKDLFSKKLEYQYLEEIRE